MYQAFLVAVILAVGVMAPLGYALAPTLLTLINAAPEVQVEALPYLRITFVTSIGMLMFFMFSGALRAAGDAKTPMRLGIVMTLMNIILNIVLIPGLGPIPAFGTRGAAIGTAIASGVTGIAFLWLLFSHPGWSFSSRGRCRSVRIGASSGNCSGSVCRPGFRASR